ncbi:DUF6804 family protein [Leifsonia poae]|uniref:Uncharacterized protein n=1 Tax=Leifsonia poae TaxID=110933 RepID=A0A9W6HBG1_9MICO|nr:DUF6804 family protein [Leifsonia poae]GLJ77466.1 hypothetical protein GCM10017584_30400 [Leifsonia poae]
MSRPAAQPAFNRTALAPGILGAIVLVAGLALIGSDWYLYVRYVVSILALILCVFAGQAKAWWWFAGLIPVAVVWNPVWPIAMPDDLLRVLHLAGAVLFVAVAVNVKVPTDQRR